MRILAFALVLVVYSALNWAFAQTTAEVFPPWSGSYIANDWLVTGKIATVPNRLLIMNGQNKVIGELIDKSSAAGAVYGAELATLTREYIAASGAATTSLSVLNALRIRMIAALQKYDEAVK
jgi:hypothetical protein